MYYTALRDNFWGICGFSTGTTSGTIDEMRLGVSRDALDPDQREGAAVEHSVTELADGVLEPLRDLGHLSLGDAIQIHGADQVVDAPD